MQIIDNILTIRSPEYRTYFPYLFTLFIIHLKFITAYIMDIVIIPTTV